MTAVVWVSLTCDGHCGEYVETGCHDLPGARTWAKQREGWDHTVSGLDLCLACASRWAEDS